MNFPVTIWWGDESSDHIPTQYLLQVAHYAAVCNVDQVDIAVLIGNSQFKLYSYMRDEKLEKKLIEAEERFWNEHVLKKTPPTPRTYQEAAQKFNVSQHSVIVSTNDINDACMDIIEKQKMIKNLQLQIDELKAKVCDYMGSNDTLADMANGTLATWKSQSRKTFDSVKFKKENPKLYNIYLKESNSRFLRIKNI